MKVKEKETILLMLEDKNYDGIKAFIKECTKDYARSTNQALRNRKWATSNSRAMDILDMAVQDRKFIKNEAFSRKTLTVIAPIAFPDRKYKYIKTNDAEYMIMRIQ